MAPSHCSPVAGRLRPPPIGPVLKGVGSMGNHFVGSGLTSNRVGPSDSPPDLNPPGGLFASWNHDAPAVWACKERTSFASGGVCVSGSLGDLPGSLLRVGAPWPRLASNEERHLVDRDRYMGTRVILRETTRSAPILRHVAAGLGSLTGHCGARTGLRASREPPASPTPRLLPPTEDPPSVGMKGERQTGRLIPALVQWGLISSDRVIAEGAPAGMMTGAPASEHWGV